MDIYSSVLKKKSRYCVITMATTFYATNDKNYNIRPQEDTVGNQQHSKSVLKRGQLVPEGSQHRFRS